MDPLAHTLVGAALARTRLARGVPFATTTLVAAANLPDVDVLSYFGGEDAALGFRRGVTHGPLGLVLLPLLLVGLVALVARGRGIDRPPLPLRRLAALAWLGTLTHPLLDLLNVYGVRLLAPFSPRWFYGDVLFIVDPWFWLILGAAVFLVREPTRPALALWLAATCAATWLALTRDAPEWSLVVWCAVVAAALLVRARWRDTLRERRETVVAAALGIWLAYLALMIAGGFAARRGVASELARRGIAEVERTMVAPVAVDPRLRDVVVELADGYLFGRYSLASGELALEPALEPGLPATPEVRAALADPSVRGFVGWARFPFARVEPAGELVRVHLIDGRYARAVPASGRRFGTATVEIRPLSAPGELRPEAAPGR
jgi:inner membrane protein